LGSRAPEGLAIPVEAGVTVVLHDEGGGELASGVSAPGTISVVVMVDASVSVSLMDPEWVDGTGWVDTLVEAPDINLVSPPVV
jgi:hypothetical protein